MEKENKKTIEIPFGAKDSELYKFEYTIPEGYEAEIKDGKVIMKKKESDDERIRKWIVNEIKATHDHDSPTSRKEVDDALAWLEKQRPEEYPQAVIENAISFLHERNDGMPIEEARDIVNAVVSVLNPKHWVREKPAEWSEEDEQMLQAIIKRYEFAVESDCAVFIKTDKLTQMEKELAWLKSLRPHSCCELDTETRDALNEVINFLASHKSSHYNDYLFSIMNRLRQQLKSCKPHWKPSEHQLEVLKLVAEKDGTCLMGLYNELKTL